MKVLNIINALIIAVGCWGILSYLDIIAHNLDAMPQYASWNLLVMLANLF